MRKHMSASILIRTHASRRVGARTRAARVATITLGFVVFHLASVPIAFVANSHAQGLAPSLSRDTPPTDLVRATLVSDVESIAVGKPFHLAVRLEIKDGWHVNWLNPGDAGLAPGIEWKVPKGFKTTVMCWPTPERFNTSSLVIFGYAKELLLVTEVTPPASLTTSEPVELAAEVSWLACEEACIPGSASLSISLPVEAAARQSSRSASIDMWRTRCPGVSGAWSVDASFGDQATLLLDLQTAEQTSANLKSAFFYPLDPGIIENASPQTISVLQGLRGQSAYQLRIELWRMATELPDRARGVLVLDDGTARAIEVDVPIRRR